MNLSESLLLSDLQSYDQILKQQNIPVKITRLRIRCNLALFRPEGPRKMEPQPIIWHAGAGMVDKPTWSPYMNYVQAFRKSYKGPPVSCPQMVRMAANSWRTLSAHQKEPFENLAKGVPRRRRAKRLQRSRRRVTASAAASRTTPGRPGARGLKRGPSDSGSDWLIMHTPSF